MQLKPALITGLSWMKLCGDVGAGLVPARFLLNAHNQKTKRTGRDKPCPYIFFVTSGLERFAVECTGKLIYLTSSRRRREGN